MTCPYFTGPQAPERNPPIQPQFLSPNIATKILASYFSADITFMAVRTVDDNQFVVGQIIRYEIGDMAGTAIIFEVIDPKTFYANITSTETTPIADPGSIILAIGDINSGAINSDGRLNNLLYIDGAFRNISPQ